IASTSKDLRLIENWLAEQPSVKAVTTTIGASLTRFLLTYTPEDPSPAYGQVVIRVVDHTQIPALRDELTKYAADTLPWVETRVQQIIYGPPVGADVEARFSGPDSMVLRQLADRAQAIFESETDLLMVERTDWREPELTTQPIFAVDRAKALGISRGDVSQAIAIATDGLRVGTFRENDRRVPIVIRTPRREQTTDQYLLDQLIYAPTTNTYTSLTQVLDGFDVVARNTLIQRRDRTPTISVQGFSVPDTLPPQAFGEVRSAIEGMALPAGYRMEWGGEFESAGAAQESLGKQMPLAFGTMFLITLLLFGKLRQTAVIWTVVPMAVTGVGLGLLFTNLPFSFTALLGLLSLSGMLIKNAIVLVEEIDAQKVEEGLPQSEAIVAASVSRLRPVVLAAATTILGMIPLLTDAFFASMAVSIMAGLGFASVLTLIGVPALYHTYLRRERREEKRARREAKAKEATDASMVRNESDGVIRPFRTPIEPMPIAAE
ncbi:MAG: efflux RND transporter permease subunit, partial [Pseudomonadota bacterium]